MREELGSGELLGGRPTLEGLSAEGHAWIPNLSLGLRSDAMDSIFRDDECFEKGRGIIDIWSGGRGTISL